MATLADAFVRLRPDDSKLGPEIKSKGEKHGKTFGTTFVRSSAGPFRAIGGVLSSSIGGVVAGLGAVAGIHVFAGFIADAEASAKVAKLTESTIRATGGAAKITAAQVGNLATAISNKTGKDDEAIQSGQNMLLTFKNIRNEAGKNNDIFNQASSILTDMVAAMNQGEVTEQNMSKGAVQLGKALNDPIKGVGALSRVGVTFTDQQKKQIAAMVKAGDVAGAQKIILGELKSEFGGAAEASSSMSDRMKVALGNLGETIGGFLLPAVEKVTGFVTKQVVPGFMAMFAAFQEGDVTSDGFVGTMERIGVAARKAFDFFKTSVLPRLKEFAGFVRDEVVPRVIDLARNVADTLAPGLEKLGGFIATKLLPALKTLGEFLVKKVLPAVTAVFGFLADHQDVVAAIGIAIAATLVPAFVAWAVSAGAAAVATIAATAPILITIGVIAALVFGIIQLVKHWDKVKEVTLTVWKAIKDAVMTAVRAVVNSFLDMVQTVINGAAKAFGWIPGLGGKLKNAAKDFAAFRAHVNEQLGGIKDRHVNILIDAKMTATARRLVGSGASDAAIKSALSKQINIGARASGGPVMAGQTYLVGEKGPELLTMGKQSGNITPNGKLPAGGPEVIELHLDLGEGIRKVVQINLSERDRGVRRRVNAGARR